MGGGTQLDIVALDSGGNQLDAAIVPNDGSLHSLTLNGPDIVSVIIGGGNEGVLVEICEGQTPEP